MKKAFGIPFMLLATFVILAHAFIPHQHHNRIAISINEASLIDKIFKHHHDHPHTNDHEHFHDHSPVNPDNEDEFSEDCLLDDLYRRLKQTRKHQLTTDDDIKSKNSARIHFIVAAPVQDIEIKDYGELPFRQNPYIPALFLSHIVCSLSFRGPPKC
jgi:hypothetical protein